MVKASETLRIGPGNSGYQVVLKDWGSKQAVLDHLEEREQLRLDEAIEKIENVGSPIVEQPQFS